MAYSEETKQQAKQYFTEGKSFSEIASVLGCDEKTIRNWARKYKWRGDDSPIQHFKKINRSGACARVQQKHQRIRERYKELIWDSVERMRRDQRDVIQKLSDDFYLGPNTIRKIITEKQG